MRRLSLSIPVLLLALIVAWPVAAQRKKKKGTEEEITQVLEVLPDPPAFATLETPRLGFLVSPLSAKGLLTQQTRDALRALMRNPRGAQIVKLRAFVAGSGDLRRIQSIVSEEFSQKKLPLPALSVVQVGGLPLEGAQVILEAAVHEKRAANPHGIAIFSGQQVVAQPQPANPLAPVAPLVEKSVANLKIAADAAGVEPAAMLHVTCLVSSLADFTEFSPMVARAYPAAAISIVQLQRAPFQSVVECEGTGRLSAAPASRVQLLNPPGLPSSPNYSQVASTNAPRIVTTGLQLAFGAQEPDAKLAFDRVGRVLDLAKVSWKDVFFAKHYPVSQSALERVRSTRFQYFDRSRPPGSTMIAFEGLSSLDASFGMEVFAAVP
ncbi:MAG: hypothetical protein SFV18_14840 [Bryobacteraceae bacterium]|nr:hypothetical protein [Bryobacteraceae bacterium]